MRRHNFAMPLDSPRVAPYLSVVVPLFNEAPTILELHARLAAVLDGLGRPYEILLVDDGSSDGSDVLLHRVADEDRAVRVITLARNFGQTAALAAGFDHARGQVIVAMDGDLQHAPEDLPRLLGRLDEGYDVVSGRRMHRPDGLWTRRVPSSVANWLMAWLSGVPLHDFGTTFKAYRRPVIRRIALHGELHRFIPALASWQGARIAEVPISSPPRVSNTSHYGLSRTWRVMSDLVTVRFLLRYATRPLHLFGPLAFVGLGLGGVGTTVVVGRKILIGGDIFLLHGPLFLTSLLLLVAGALLLALGLVAELLVRVYYDGRRKRIYTLRRQVRLTASSVGKSHIASVSAS